MFFESLLGCFAVAVLLAILVMPIIAIVRTSRIRDILDRMRRLEDEVRRLRESRYEPAEERRGESSETIPTITVAESSPPESADSVPEASAADVELGRRRPHSFRPPAAPTWTSADLEAWLGARGLGWLATLLLLLAAAFFFREIFNRGLIGPLGRVALGVIAGLAACLAGYRQHRRGWPVTCQMLTTAGVVLLYLSFFASFGFYQLLEQDRASVFLVLIVAEAFGLALVYDAPAIALMAVLGGLLNPVLLRSDHDRYVSLFLYLGVLNAGVVGSLLLRRWWALSLVTIAGTQGLFWLWYSENYHPQKLSACLSFHIGIAGLWMGYQFWGPMLRYVRANAEDLVRVVAVAFLLAAAGYVLLDERIPDWMGTMAVALAILHTAVLWMVLKGRPDDGPHALVQLALAMGFLAMVFPLQTRAPWVAVGWAVQGLALWWFGLRIRSIALGGMGAILLLFAVLRFFFVQSLGGRPHFEPFVPLFNEYALPGVVVAVCLILASVLARREGASDSEALVAGRVAGFAGLALLWVILSFDAYDYFQVQRPSMRPGGFNEMLPDEMAMDPEIRQRYLNDLDVHMGLCAQVALSAVWGIYAIVLLAIGLRLPSRPLRWSALALLGITLLKVLTVDMERLPGLYRVAAFFVLSMLMFLAAWGYQKVKRSLLAMDEEAADASPL